MTYSDYGSMHAPPRWFDGGPARLLKLLMLSAALCGGMLVGGFLSRTHMQEVVYDLEAELNARDAEIGILQHEAGLPTPEGRELEVLTAEHEQLQRRLRELEKTAADRQQRILQAVHHSEADRDACLHQLKRLVETEKLVTAADVVRFASSMFDSRKQMLLAIANSEAQIPSPPTVPAWSGVGESAIADARGASNAAGPQFANTAGSARGPIPPPHDAGAHQFEESQDGHDSQTAFHFDPPPQRRTSYTYCPPARRSHVASTEKPRIVFSDPETTPGRAVR